MKTTYFYKKNGNISSMRTTAGSMKNKLSLSRYAGNSRGGVTFKNSGITSRFNNNGQSMGTSMKVGKYTNYFNPYGKFILSMKQF